MPLSVRDSPKRVFTANFGRWRLHSGALEPDVPIGGRSCSGYSVCEFCGVDEADPFHSVALSCREYFRHDVVLRVRIGTQMDLRLRTLFAFRPEVTLQLLKGRDGRAVPCDSAIEVDIQIDHLWRYRTLRRP